jgi:hypothetical protein
MYLHYMTRADLDKLATDRARVNDSNKMTESPRSPFITEIQKKTALLPAISFAQTRGVSTGKR